MGAGGVRVLLADDHLGVRRALATWLRASPNIEVVGQASTACEAVALALSLAPDVLLTEVELPNRSGIEACREICERLPGVRVIFLTTSLSNAARAQAFEAGAEAFLFKALDLQPLLHAIRGPVRDAGHK